MSEYIQQDDPTNFTAEINLFYSKNALSGTEQLVLLTKAQQEREKRKKRIREFFQLGSTFKYFVHFVNLSFTSSYR